MSVIFPFPALHPETLDYTNPESYEGRVERTSKTQIVVSHSIDRGNLVHELIKQERAIFCATVSVRGSIYRRTEIAREAELCETDNGYFCKQVIEVPDFLDELETFIISGVTILKKISAEEIKRIFVSQTEEIRDVQSKIGLSGIFLDGNINFPEKALIAHSGWRRFFSFDSLFQIKADKKFKPNGAFSTEFDHGQFKILITMAPALYDEINQNKNSPARSQVICASLTKALEEIHSAHLRIERATQGEEMSETDLQLLEQAEGLKNFFESHIPRIPTWEDENFNSTHAASMYRPATQISEAQGD